MASNPGAKMFLQKQARPHQSGGSGRSEKDANTKYSCENQWLAGPAPKYVSKCFPSLSLFMPSFSPSLSLSLSSPILLPPSRSSLSLSPPLSISPCSFQWTRIQSACFHHPSQHGTLLSASTFMALWVSFLISQAFHYLSDTQLSLTWTHWVKLKEARTVLA